MGGRNEVVHVRDVVAWHRVRVYAVLVLHLCVYVTALASRLCVCLSTQCLS